jgi:ankyrin repeat protein
MIYFAILGDPGNELSPLYKGVFDIIEHTSDEVINPGVAPSLPCNFGHTSIMYTACQKGLIRAVRFLLTRFTDKELQSSEFEGVSALCIACKKGHVDIVRLLVSRCIKRGIDTKVTIKHQDLMEKQCIGNLDYTVTSKRRDFYGTLLTTTCEFGYVDIARVLLDQKYVDVNVPSKLQKSSFIQWIMQNSLYEYLDAVRALETSKKGGPLTKDWHVTYEASKYPLYYACQHGDAEMVDMLLSVPGIDVNTVNQFVVRNHEDQRCMRRTALNVACRNGWHSIVRSLLKRPDIDVNKTFPLRAACLSGFTQTVDILLTRDDVDVESPTHGSIRSSISIDIYADLSDPDESDADECECESDSDSEEEEESIHEETPIQVARRSGDEDIFIAIRLKCIEKRAARIAEDVSHRTYVIGVMYTVGFPPDIVRLVMSKLPPPLRYDNVDLDI